MKDFSELDLENLIVDAPIGKKKICLLYTSFFPRPSVGEGQGRGVTINFVI